MKHAYLITAHEDDYLLKKLLMSLDCERNDIYIHLDRKSKLNENDYTEKKVCKKSQVFFVERISVNWGAFSIIQSALILLELAVKQGPYEYYHFLSGADLPLKKQSEILEFYDQHKGIQFISITECQLQKTYMDRIKYYYPTQELFGRSSKFGRFCRKVLVLLQKIVGVNRIKLSKYGVGSAFGDITDDFAKYILSNKEFVYKHFKMGFCADEMFIQTLFYQTDEFKRFSNPNNEHPYIQKTYFDVMRAIDWTRGAPYVYRMEDYKMLKDSKCLFARKFSSKVDVDIINKIVDDLL